MMAQILIGIGLAAVVAIVWKSLTASIDGAVDAAIESGDLGPLVDAIRQKSVASQPTVYNHAIRRMWDAYERPLAAQLIRTLAAEHHTERITQYWLKQALEAEPGLARKAFDERFLSTYYQPEVAASCGNAG